MINAWRKQTPENFKLNEDEWPGSNVRKPNESFADYKIRRMVQNNYMKIYLRGRVFWNSKEAGTYRKNIRGDTFVNTKPGNWDNPNILKAV